MRRGPHPGRLDRAEPLANPSRAWRGMSCVRCDCPWQGRSSWRCSAASVEPSLAQDDTWPKHELYVVYGDDDPVSAVHAHLQAGTPRGSAPRAHLLPRRRPGGRRHARRRDARSGKIAAGGGLGEPYVTFLAGYRLLDQATGRGPLAGPAPRCPACRALGACPRRRVQRRPGSHLLHRRLIGRPPRRHARRDRTPSTTPIPSWPASPAGWTAPSPSPASTT